MIVEWHEGCPLWAGDTENHPCGWYLYGGEAGPDGARRLPGVRLKRLLGVTPDAKKGNNDD